ncbi:deoxyhypusine hydroxylase-like [Amphiura filiformis]|uniref:deoxyhypusine hydroxylase-like n=1 Tax=Amphiura filiformis TaxID=82378 RepID=UPI003B2196B4
MNTDYETVRKIGDVLNDPKEPLAGRFRALFTLRNLGGQTAIDCISKCFGDSSALLKHECAYCLGQMQDKGAIPALESVLRDENQETIVRHEAGEALGAIGADSVLDILEEFQHSEIQEISETCQLAIQRIQWLHSQKKHDKSSKLSANPFESVDPAPPAEETTIETLRERLLDEKLSLFDRYRAMFALRNHNSEESVKALAEGLQCSNSALFRHEIAYVLGQMQHKVCVPQLMESLKKLEENAMVRHECAEALGSIAQDESEDILKEYAKDKERVVRESCEVALDMCEYEQSGDLHYADGLIKVQEAKA